MRYEITIETTSAAFADDGDENGDGVAAGREVARILRNIARRCEELGLETRAIRDVYGNLVGECGLRVRKVLGK